MERNHNSYYDLAKEDCAFIAEVSGSKRYNNIVVLCQQACEKLLKSVAQYAMSEELYIRQHKLHRINNVLMNTGINLGLSEADLNHLSDFYFDARYPGDSFIQVNESEVVRAVQITHDVSTAVDTWRKEQGLPVYDIEDTTNGSLVTIASKIE